MPISESDWDGGGVRDKKRETHEIKYLFFPFGLCKNLMGICSLFQLRGRRLRRVIWILMEYVMNHHWEEGLECYQMFGYNPAGKNYEVPTRECLGHDTRHLYMYKDDVKYDRTGWYGGLEGRIWVVIAVLRSSQRAGGGVGWGGDDGMVGIKSSSYNLTHLFSGQLYKSMRGNMMGKLPTSVFTTTTLGHVSMW